MIPSTIEAKSEISHLAALLCHFCSEIDMYWLSFFSSRLPIFPIYLLIWNILKKNHHKKNKRMKLSSLNFSSIFAECYYYVFMNEEMLHTLLSTKIAYLAVRAFTQSTYFWYFVCIKINKCLFLYNTIPIICSNMQFWII